MIADHPLEKIRTLVNDLVIRAGLMLKRPLSEAKLPNVSQIVKSPHES